MDIFWFKFLSVLIILCAGFIGGIAPLRLKLSTSRERHLRWGNAFSGGVFFGAGLLHMIPDAIEHSKNFAPDLQFPFVLLITGLAFLFILLLEKVVAGGHEGISKLLGSRPVYPFTLALILSVHSLIAGTVLGLEDTLVESFAIFVAIFPRNFLILFVFLFVAKPQLQTSASYRAEPSTVSLPYFKAECTPSIRFHMVFLAIHWKWKTSPP